MDNKRVKRRTLGIMVAQLGEARKKVSGKYNSFLCPPPYTKQAYRSGLIQSPRIGSLAEHRGYLYLCRGPYTLEQIKWISCMKLINLFSYILMHRLRALAVQICSHCYGGPITADGANNISLFARGFLTCHIYTLRQAACQTFVTFGSHCITIFTLY